MTAPAPLRAKDESEFEQLVHQALRSADIQHAIRQAPPGLTTAHLYEQAMAERHTIAATAGTEYQAYLERRGAAGLNDRRRRTGTTPSADGYGFLAAAVVLTPVFSSATATLFLALGYGISLSGTQEALAEALTGAGYTAVIVALASIAIGVTCLLLTAARHRSSPPEGTCERVAELRRLHESWRQALLIHGIRPFLHDRLHQSHSPLVTQPAPRTDQALTGSAPRPEDRRSQAHQPGTHRPLPPRTERMTHLSIPQQPRRGERT
jgi:hypothetical protein